MYGCEFIKLLSEQQISIRDWPPSVEAAIFESDELVGMLCLAAELEQLSVER